MITPTRRGLLGALAAALVLFLVASRTPQVKAKRALPPPPVVTYSPADAKPGEKIEHGELILRVDDATRQLHAQHHSYQVRRLGEYPADSRHRR